MAEHHPLRKPSYFYDEVARSKGLDYKLVRDINKWFWSQGVRRNMSEATHRSIYIRFIGTITMSRAKLNREILKIIRAIRYTRSRKFIRESSRDMILEQKYTIIRSLLWHRNQFAIERRANQLQWRKNKLQRALKNKTGEQDQQID